MNDGKLLYWNRQLDSWELVGTVSNIRLVESQPTPIYDQLQREFAARRFNAAMVTVTIAIRDSMTQALINLSAEMEKVSAALTRSFQAGKTHDRI